MLVMCESELREWKGAAEPGELAGKLCLVDSSCRRVQGRNSISELSLILVALRLKNFYENF